MGVIIDKYNLLSNYAVARSQAFKPTTIISAFRKCGISPLNEGAVPEALFEPAQNYTTQAAMPVAPRLTTLLVPNARQSSSSSIPSIGSTSSASGMFNGFV
jgi:hypothetical protein